MYSSTHNIRWYTEVYAGARGYTQVYKGIQGWYTRVYSCIYGNETWNGNVMELESIIEQGVGMTVRPYNLTWKMEWECDLESWAGIRPGTFYLCALGWNETVILDSRKGCGSWNENHRYMQSNSNIRRYKLVYTSIIIMHVHMDIHKYTKVCTVCIPWYTRVHNYGNQTWNWNVTLKVELEWNLEQEMGMRMWS